MKLKFKKILAFTLALITFLTVFEQISFANLQAPVRELNIANMPNITETSYSFRLNWIPGVSSLPDNSAIPPDDTDIHQPEDYAYDIFFRNATSRAPYPNSPQIALDRGGVNLHDFVNQSLDTGSLYMYRVIPWHLHNYWAVDPISGLPIIVQRRAPMDNSMPSPEVLYMSDINVVGEGVGSDLRVTWDNPTIDGQDVFSGYRIYYSPGGASLENFPDNPSIDVPMDDPRLVRNSDDTLEFTITDPSLQIGRFYAIKVEPMISNTSLLRPNGRQVNVNGNIYQIAYTTREYRSNEAYLSPSLYIADTGGDTIRLFWDRFPQSLTVNRIEIFSSLNESFEPNRLIGTLSGTSANTINFWFTERPSVITYFKIVVYFEENGEILSMESNIPIYDPRFNDFDPYKPRILEITDNGANPLNLNITWEAFMRIPYNEDEIPLGDPYNLFLDRDVDYDIWITDSLRNFDNSNFLIEPMVTLSGLILNTVDSTNINGIPVIGYTSSFTEYVTVDEAGNFVNLPLEENKIYYVRIVATRVPTGQISDPALGAHYIPPIGDIDLAPNMISAPPVRIKLDDAGVEMITENTVDIQWDIRWFEAYSEEDRSWFVQIGVDNSGNIVFGDATAELSRDRIIMLNEPMFTDGVPTNIGMARIIQTLVNLGASEDSINLLPLRIIDLRDSQYEIHVVDFDFMEESNTIESYLRFIIDNDDEWSSITPGGDPLHPDFTVTNSNRPTTNALTPNTSYIIFFRPYRITDVRKVAYYPTFVSATTLQDRGDIIITPTVPTLIPVEAGDTFLTVKWEYNSIFEYELSYSELVSDYPDNGIVIDNATIVEEGEIVQENNVIYMYYTINYLFPETLYYIWLRASHTINGDTIYSRWSNHIYMITTEVEAPNPPRGLGLGSRESLRIYNTENNTEYTPISEDYITIEWMRDFYDTINLPNFGGTNADGNQILFSENFLGTYLVKFNNLIYNREYFVRAKTVLTVVRTTEGIAREYNYVIQLSPDEDFTDVYEIVAPPMLDISDLTGNQAIRVESVWSNTLRFRTQTSTGEYDADINPDHFPLPEDDFEITYDSYTQTLTFRFLTNEVSSSGDRDNNVDQRFISRLIASRTFEYTIDVSHYSNRPITNRVINIPFSIISAFNRERIDLKIRANNMTLVISPDTFTPLAITNTIDFGVDSRFIINLSEDHSNILPLGYNQGFVSQPHNIDVSVIGNATNTSIDSLKRNITVYMNLDNRYSLLDFNVGAVASSNLDNTWNRVSNTNFNNTTGDISFEISRLGSVAVIANTMPASYADLSTTNNLYTVFNSILIEDLETFDPNSPVSALQINNIISGIANNNLSFTMNTPLTNEAYQMLGNSRLLVPGQYVTRETGLNSLVRLYELKTRATIQNHPSSLRSRLMDLNSVSEQYRESMLKSEYLGFIEGTSVNPQASLTFGDLFNILSIIVLDSNM